MLSPELATEAWTLQEDALLIQLRGIYGNQWALIAGFLPGRSRVALKNRWSLHARHQKRALVKRATSEDPIPKLEKDPDQGQPAFEQIDEQRASEKNAMDPGSIWSNVDLEDLPDGATQLWLDPPTKAPDGLFPWSN
jgi:hypothetical protein